MSALLLICGLVAVGSFMFRSSPRRRVIYVPIEMTEAPRRLGCLPIILISFIVYLALSMGGLIRL